MISHRSHVAALVAGLVLAGGSGVGGADALRVDRLPRYELPRAQPPTPEPAGNRTAPRAAQPDADGRQRTEPSQPPAAAPKSTRPFDGAGAREPRWTPQRPPHSHPPPAHHRKPGYVVDRRHGHNHYYPVHGYLAPVLPPRHRVVRHRFDTYYFHGGAWYAPSGTHYAVVRPPVGLPVPWLPPYYRIFWARSIPYYYAGGVYYNWAPQYGQYVVAEPPAESDIVYPAADGDAPIAYPAQNQSEEQQETDRHECHQWAATRTGFDPSQLDGRVTPEQYPALGRDYNRALRACLEGRGYSVQ